jgi:hypothetical protein
VAVPASLTLKGFRVVHPEPCRHQRMVHSTLDLAHNSLVRESNAKARAFIALSARGRQLYWRPCYRCVAFPAR